MTDKKLRALDDCLREYSPDIYNDLQPGRSTNRRTPRDLQSWFAWRNGQPSTSQYQLFDTYSFVSYEDATAQLAETRSTLWRHSAQFIALMILSRRSFYSLPLLTDGAGDGYWYHLMKRRPFYRFEGESDIFCLDLITFIDFLCEFVSQPSANAAQTCEDRFLDMCDR